MRAAWLWILAGTLAAQDLRRHARVVLEQVDALADAVALRRAAAVQPGLDLVVRAMRAGVEAPSVVEEFVRSALGRQVPGAVLAACAAALGDRGQPPRPRRLGGLGEVEDRLERIHREVVRALGTGRDPELLASRLQGLLENVRTGPEPAPLADSHRAELEDLLDRGARVDIVALLRQAVAAVGVAEGLADPGLQQQLLARPQARGERGVAGTVIADRDTPFGRFVVGGPGPNRYATDQIAVIVDLGGDDEYDGPAGAAGIARRFALVIDLSGNDHYRAANDGIGSACLGLGLVYDRAGNDRYEAAARGVGFGALGVGALFDLGGDDTVDAGRHCGGVGFAGVGVWLDGGGGRDRAAAVTPCLGAGIAGGIGMLVDDGGDDERTVAVSAAGSEGCLGLGAGIGGVAAGGLGLVVDVAGDDRTTAPDFAAGCAVDQGLGCYVDVGGADVLRLGSHAAGAAHAGGLAVYLDSAGDDKIAASAGPSIGVATSGGYAWCEDRSGNDGYDAGAGGLGWARDEGLAVVYDGAGSDRYRLGAEPAAAAADRSGSLAVFSDAGGGEDRYESADLAVGNGMRLRAAGGASGRAVRVRDDR